VKQRGAKKDKKCDEEERSSGKIVSILNHVAIDYRSKLIVSMIQGPSRDQISSDLLIQDFADRTNHKPTELVTTDEHASYESSLLEIYGISYRPRRKNGKQGRKKKLKKTLAEEHELCHGQKNLKKWAYKGY
jgi:hypothetical protein